MPNEKIILSGFSIGTVATVHLAARHLTAGVIIQSGFISATRIIWKEEPPIRGVCHCCHGFLDNRQLFQVESPVLIIHGMNDFLTDYAHALEMYRLCKNPVEPLFIKNCGHTGVIVHKEFYARLKRFVEEDLEERTRATLVQTEQPQSLVSTLPSNPGKDTVASEGPGQGSKTSGGSTVLYM